MKHLFVFLLLKLSLALITVEDLSCKTQILQFYGLGGLVQPVSYYNILKQLNADYCPGIEYSCCSFTDFRLTHTKWLDKAELIKRYLTKMFRVIQKTTVLQGSLLQIASSIKGKNSKFCREVDSTFFNNPIHYDEVYYYLQNALDGFAFIQKGFYCAICDAKNHQYLGLIREPTRKVAIVDVKFCNDLIFFFREFIMFKVFFLDPFIVNTNYLLNCHKNTDKYKYEFEYMTQYQMIEGCVERGENCEFVCKEFRFGASSELFMGKMKKFFEFFKNVEEVVTEFNPAIKVDVDNEFNIDEDDYPSEFFTETNNLEDSQTSNLLKDFNLSNFEINIESKGINLFDIADHSHYFLTNARTRSSVIKNFGLDMPGSGTLANDTALDNEITDTENTSLTTSPIIQSYKEEEDWEKKHEEEKLSQDPNTPSKAELSTLELERDRLEQQMVLEIKARGSIDHENGIGYTDFNAAKSIPEGESNIGGTVIAVVCLVTLLYK